MFVHMAAMKTPQSLFSGAKSMTHVSSPLPLALDTKHVNVLQLLLHGLLLG
jgi:hypothetical protein